MSVSFIIRVHYVRISHRVTQGAVYTGLGVFDFSFLSIDQNVYIQID